MSVEKEQYYLSLRQTNERLRDQVVDLKALVEAAFKEGCEAVHKDNWLESEAKAELDEM